MEIQQIRELYAQANESNAKAMLFLKAIEQSKKYAPSPLLKAYQAAALAIQARDSWNPLEKLSLIQQANQWFAEAVTQDKENIEIRFIRFSIQVNTPFILGMSANLEEDHTWIVENITQEAMPEAMRPEVAKYLLKKNQGKREELEKLKLFLDS